MDTRPNLMPKARKDRLIIKELPDETLVYDLDSDKAYCLNRIATVVWQNCDGGTSIDEVAVDIGKATGLKVDNRIVTLALSELDKLRLLEKVDPRMKVSKISRRELIRSIGLNAVALPVIIAITTQTAHAQVSPCSGATRPDGCPCTGNGQCIPSHKCVGGFCAP